MDEDQGRASPPLPSSRGSYNIDFDAIDDSFNPFQTKRFIRNSPPLCGREPSSSADGESVAQESHQAESDSRLQDSSSSCSLKETSEAPKKRKSKSPSGKQAALARDAETCPGSDDTQSAGNLMDAAAAAAAVAEKPVKPRKVVKKPKSRPSSKNLEGQGCAERLKPSDEPEISAAPAAGNDNEATLPQPTSTSSDIPQDAMTVQEPSNPLLEEASLQTGKTSQNSEKTPLQSEEKTLHESETALPLPESTRPRSASGASEEGAEGTPKKERSAGKVKKSKTKARKSSSSPRPVSSGDMDGVDSPVRTAEESAHTAKHDKESKSLPRASFEGDGVGSHDSAVDSDVHKPKHPAARVLEQKVREDSHSQSISRNNLPNDSEDDFYDAFDSPPPVATHMMDPMQSYSDMNDSCMLFQSHDHLGGLSWAQEEGGLLDEGAGEAAFAEDLTIGDPDMADSHSTESVVKLVQVLKYSQSDWNKLRQELELNFQAQLLAKEREWSSKLADRDTRLATLEDNNKKLRQINEDMRAVMAEFEKTIGQLQSEKEKTTNASQQSLQDVVKERDQALEDLQSVETAFSDLHRRYEKTKGVLDGFKQNEEMLKKCVQDLQNKLKKTEQKVQIVKMQAEEKLEKATEEIEKTQKSSSSEIARLEAALRKAELQVQSMESSLEQKVKENKELAAICDELIAKVQ